MIYCYDKRIIKNEDIIKEINNVRKNIRKCNKFVK